MRTDANLTANPAITLVINPAAVLKRKLMFRFMTAQKMRKSLCASFWRNCAKMRKTKGLLQVLNLLSILNLMPILILGKMTKFLKKLCLADFLSAKMQKNMRIQ